MPETAAGLRVLAQFEPSDSEHPRHPIRVGIDAIEAEARALGRAEALAAVDGLTLDGTWPSAYDAGYQRAITEARAAIDNLETPDPELDAYAAGFNPARHADGEEL